MDMDIQQFYRGQSFDAYAQLGAHTVFGGCVFRTFAPAAKGITILHDGFETPMERVADGNFWEGYVPGLKDGDTYEYRIYTQDGGSTDHADPYGFGMELRPRHKSVIRYLDGHEWHDEAWMSARTPRIGEPLNIYEMHLGSWKKRRDGEVDPESEAGVSRLVDPEDWYTYAELAPLLVDYLKENNYNYVEFMPLAEHPVDASWGYQTTGFFAPTSRYGTPEQLMELVDALHQAGIGVILDFVPVHFAVDDYGLRRFDGTALFEYPHDAVGVSEWGSCNFMHSRGETCSFLQSCANYWLEEYHFDGLRMDAISRIIYWQGDPGRGVNANAVQFVQTMNAGLKDRHPGCILAAEDSTDFAGTTRPVRDGGLGYDYKWDMGWMNDTLDFMKKTPDERRQEGVYHKLSFSMMYFPNERYLLPLSHDENVHGKATVLNKMWGAYETKFPQARLLYLYMMVHPGKKLNFMGGEFGQMREWDETRQQDWDMLAYPAHDAFCHYMRELWGLYLDHGSLSEWDYGDGFQWLQTDDPDNCVFAIERRNAGERMVVVLNFGDRRHEGYEVAVAGVAAVGAGAGDATGDAGAAGTGDAGAAGTGDACAVGDVGDGAAGDADAVAADAPAGRPANVLLDTDWARFGGTTPDGETDAMWTADGLRVTLAPFSGVLVKV